MPHTLFLLSPLSQRGGNYFTISRIRDHLRKEGYECHLYDPKDFLARQDFNPILSQDNVGIMIGIHALHTGAFMKDSSRPYILILGGTDINSFCNDQSSMKIMTEAVYRARFVVCFSKMNQMKALTLWPGIHPGRLKLIPQGVETCPSSFSLKTYLSCYYRELMPAKIGREPIIFVFVGGVRPPKNPLFLVSAFQDWHARDERIIYLVVGPKLDEKFTTSVFEPAINKRPGVVYIPGMSSHDTHAVIAQSFALVNSSDSEGMCLAILEAMNLRIPVLARDIPGNRAIVTDGHTGFLFNSPQMFLDKAERLLADNETRSRLTKNAQEYIQRSHSMDQEREAYKGLLKQCINQMEDGSA